MFGRNSIRKKAGQKPDACCSNGHLIDLQQVVKTFESDAGVFVALNGIDLQVQAGRFVSIIGKSGSGKSTLLNMVTGIDKPTAGKVLVNGTAVHTLDEEEIAVWRGRNIGVIFQFFQLLPTLTAVENVLLAMDYGNIYPPEERPERAMALLEVVGMADQAHKLPPTLSGGQQQSIAVARALANDPPILTADEPTGNLDSKTAGLILDLFEDLVDTGKTILMVTHDKALARRAQSTIVLADGQIVDLQTNGSGLKDLGETHARAPA
jgi:putative ABC transport system ATP-binding protein